jgi:hypothetical protein
MLMPALLVVILVSQAPAQARPDLSGAWTFDQAKTMAQPGPDGRFVLAAMLGDDFVAKQDADTLTLTINAGGQKVVAVYRFDGTETRNVSPGDIIVRSRTSWDDQKLVIHSTSEGMEKGRAITIETRRVIWLDRDGFLIIERTGSPASAVTPSRSVYRRTPRG